MENLQSSLSTPRSSPEVSLLSPSVAGGSGSCSAVVQAAKDIKMTPEEQLVLNLCNPELRGNALAELSKRRETLKNLAPLLWYSFGTMTVLLQEILSVYPAVLSPSTLSASASNRACNALALLQTIASHPETRTLFVQAEFPLYLYVFLDCANNGTNFEYLRLTALGVLGALVKVDDAGIINFFLRTEIIPLCLKIMEMGSERAKLVAAYIIERILVNDAGLMYVCVSVDRFFHLASALANMVAALVDQPSTKVLKRAIFCYLRLIDNPRALVALRISFPEALKDGTLDNLLREEPVAIQCLELLLDRLKDGSAWRGAPLPGSDPAASGSAWGGAPPPGSGHAAGGNARASQAGQSSNIWAWP